MDDGMFARFLAQLGPRGVIETLAPYVSQARQQRIADVTEARLAGLTVAVESPSDPHNAAAMVRSADALGVSTVHVSGIEGHALKAPRPTQGAHHWVRTRHHASLELLFAEVNTAGMRVAGAVVDGPVEMQALPVEQPLCLLFGNEKRGLSDVARERCDLLFRVPMFGMTESMNLSVCAALCMFETGRRMRARFDGQGDLQGEALALEQARFYVRAVDGRTAFAMLKRAAPDF